MERSGSGGGFEFGDVFNPQPNNGCSYLRPNPVPKTVDPLDWECPNFKCRNINFKKRDKCNRCGEKRGAPISQAPIEKKKAIEFDWWCMNCGIKNAAVYMRCTDCSNMRPEERANRAEQHGGKAGGFFDRQDPGDRNQWDSDEESVDDFGRKKKKKPRLTDAQKKMGGNAAPDRTPQNAASASARPYDRKTEQDRSADGTRRRSRSPRIRQR